MYRALHTVLVTAALGCGMPMSAPPRASAPCSQENVGECESQTRLLVCRGRAWQVLSDCKGPRGCSKSGDTVDCDTSLNGLGDRCASPGRVRCDPDGGLQILRCLSDGLLGLELSCPRMSGVQTACVASDAGLTCE
ncbi:MAG: hypothetical protein INH41_28130 [Myxococcaceae bacterium]|jgi:hypothetical protein|nr:hypothetical protein [Myxococcaceae bacterium]MCA3016270.1 hypothetical protein [Myxococcaceae bacterium]